MLTTRLAISWLVLAASACRPGATPDHATRSEPASQVSVVEPTDRLPAEHALEALRFAYEDLDPSSRPNDYPSIATPADGVAIALQELGSNGTRILRRQGDSFVLSAAETSTINVLRADARGTVHFIGHTGFQQGDLGNVQLQAGRLGDPEPPERIERCPIGARPMLAATPAGAVAAYGCGRQVHIARSGPWRIVARSAGWRVVGLDHDPRARTTWIAVTSAIDVTSATEGGRRGILLRLGDDDVLETQPLPDPTWSPEGLAIGADGTLWAVFSYFTKDAVVRSVVAQLTKQGWGTPRPIPGEGWVHRLVLAQARGGLLLLDEDNSEGLQIHRLAADGSWSSIRFPDPRAGLVRDAVLDASGNLHVAYAWTSGYQQLGYVIGHGTTGDLTPRGSGIPGQLK